MNVPSADNLNTTSTYLLDGKTYSGRFKYGLPAPYGLLTLSGEYGLPNRPYGFDVELGRYGFALSSPPLLSRGGFVA